MTAFFKDLAARGHRDRVLMMTFSEFGRRVKENGSRGTDHGSAAPMLLVGGKVKAGVVGKHPSLTDLEMGNLKYTHRFPPGLRRHPRPVARRLQQGRAGRQVRAGGDLQELTHDAYEPRPSRERGRLPRDPYGRGSYRSHFRGRLAIQAADS